MMGLSDFDDTGNDKMDFLHFDSMGNARMVDVSGKEVTERTARAVGTIFVNKEVFEAVAEGKVKKGDVLTVAQVAGIMATKRTDDMIPMCHSIPLTNAELVFSLLEEPNRILAECTVKTVGKTGAEMEALMGVSTALLTIYDMCKSMDKRMCISDVHLVEKSGGKSGDFIY